MAILQSRPQGSHLGVVSRHRVSANLSLKFELSGGTSGRTILGASRQEPPLRVLRAFAREDGSALAHLHNVSGGLLGGDRLCVQVDLECGTQVQVTTTGATRIYRAAPDPRPTEQQNRVHVGEDALLEYVPDSTIPFAGARFRQNSEIHLARGAGLFWWEILAPGREARGEVFAYDQVRMQTDIYGAGRLIAAERILLEPATRSLQQWTRLGEYRYWITFYICRVGVEAAGWLELEEQLREQAQHLRGHGDDMIWAISALPAHGIAIRGLARRGHRILSALHSLWASAKVVLYGREPVMPRKLI